MFEVLVGVVAFQFGHLARLTIAEEDELQRVEAKDGGIGEHLVVHAAVEVTEQRRAVERP